MIDFNVPPYGYAISKGCGYGPHFNHCVDTSIAHVSDTDGHLLGGVIFTQFTGRTVTIHVAAVDKKWLSHDMRWVLANYAFDLLKCEAVIAQVNGSLDNVLDIASRIGFKKVARVPDYFIGYDLVILCLKREDCRWLNLKPRCIQRKNNGQHS